MGTTANIRTGAFAYLEYDFETTFDTGGVPCGACGKVFGFEQKVTGWTWTNNRIVLNQLNSIEPKTYAYGQARGSMSVDFVVSNPWYNELLFSHDDMCCCACFPTSCVSPFTYTWDDSANDRMKDTTSFTAEVGIQACCCDFKRVVSGAIVNSVALRSTVGEVVRATVDISYATDVSMCATIDTTPAADTVGVAVCQFIPYTFAHGTLKFPTACDCMCVIAELQSFDVTLNPNADLLWSHNSNHAINAYRRVFEITGTFNASYVDQTNFNKVLAQIGDDSQTLDTCQVELEIAFDNGCAGAAQRLITYTFTGISIGEHSTSVEPVEPIFETISWQARTAQVTALNGTSAFP